MKCEMDMKKLYVMAESAEEQKALNNLSEIMVGNDVFLNSGDDRAEVIAEDVVDTTPPASQMPKEEVTPEPQKEEKQEEKTEETSELPDFDNCTLAEFSTAVRDMERADMLDICKSYGIEIAKGSRATTVKKLMIEWKRNSLKAPSEPTGDADATQTTEPTQEAATTAKAPEKPEVAESGENNGPPNREDAMNAAREFIAVYGDPAFKKVLDKFNARTFSEVPEVSYAQFISELEKQGEEEKANNA